jgi:uncharacterized membrane protein YuzA (DUF378 family)
MAISITTIQPLNTPEYGFQQTFSYDSNVSGAADVIIGLGALNAPLTIGAVGPASLVSSIQGTASSTAEILAGTAIWVDITGLTAIADTAKQVSVPGPYTGLRINVGTPQVGALKVAVRMASYSVFTN